MIKFFKNIRKRMRSEDLTVQHGLSNSSNRMGRYLLYAVGEIILVVIGILIALQINNLNNYQKDRKEEQILLQNMKQEFTKNLNELHSDHMINVASLEAAYFYLNADMAGAKPAIIDSLVGKLCTYATFDPSIGYISQAISSGKLDLVQSDSLKIYLSQWSGELNDLREDVIIRRDHWLDHLLPTIRKYIPIRNTDQAQNRIDYPRQKVIHPIKIPNKNYKEFTRSLEVDGVIFDHYMNHYYVVINEERIESYILKVLELIERSIH